jgi:hypothetical protein
VNPNSISEHEINGKNPYDILVYPNPHKNIFTIEFNTHDAVDVRYYLTNNSGQIVFASETKAFATGENTIEVNLQGENNDRFLHLTVIFNEQYYVSKKLSAH